MSPLQHYKNFVKQHPGLVLNLERLLHWVAWNPERFSGSEFAYEAFNAAVGLLGIYNESIIAEHPDYNATVAKYAFLLAAVEQVSVLTFIHTYSQSCTVPHVFLVRKLVAQDYQQSSRRALGLSTTISTAAIINVAIAAA